MTVTAPETVEQYGRGPRFIEDIAEQLATQIDAQSAAAALARLVQFDVSAKQERSYQGVVGGQTDGSGNAVIKLYDVPEGYNGHLTRILAEADGVTPASAATVSNPAGAGWLGVFELEQGTTTPSLATLKGAGRDFAPATPGGAILPILFTDNDSNAWAYRGGKAIYFVTQGAILNKQITVAFRVNLQFQPS